MSMKRGHIITQLTSLFLLYEISILTFIFSFFILSSHLINLTLLCQNDLDKVADLSPQWVQRNLFLPYLPQDNDRDSEDVIQHHNFDISNLLKKDYKYGYLLHRTHHKLNNRDQDNTNANMFIDIFGARFCMMNLYKYFWTHILKLCFTSSICSTS